MSETLNLSNLDEPGFQQLYETRLKPCYETHEPARLEAVATYKRRLMYAIPAVLAVFIASFFWRAEGLPWVILIAGAIAAFAWAYAKIHQVQSAVKRSACEAVAEAIGVCFRMNGFDPPAFPRLREMALVPGFDRSNFEDLFTGAHEGAAFDLYEAHLEQKRRGNKGRTYWVTVFRGQIIRLAFPRKFLGITIVRRDAGMFNAFGVGRGLERVRLEDPVFEKAFEVYGNDQVEARYLLHPAFMQRLVDLEAHLKGKRLRCAFEEGDLLIAIEGGNLYEVGDMFQPLADPKRARQIVEDVAGVMRVMDSVITAQARRPG